MLFATIALAAMARNQAGGRTKGELPKPHGLLSSQSCTLATDVVNAEADDLEVNPVK